MSWSDHRAFKSSVWWWCLCLLVALYRKSFIVVYLFNFSVQFSQVLSVYDPLVATDAPIKAKVGMEEWTTSLLFHTTFHVDGCKDVIAKCVS